MGTLHRKSGRAAVLVALILLLDVAQSSKVWSEVAFPEDMEAERGGRLVKRFLAESDDEDFAMDEASGERPSGEEDGSTTGSNIDIQGVTVYYRALVNFTNSFVYGPELEDINSPLFKEITDAVVDTLESEYNKIPGYQTVNVIIIKKLGNDVFVELDVGSEENMNTEQIRDVLFSVVQEGSIASYVTSVHGFQFRRLGGGDLEISVDTPLLVSVDPIPSPVQVDHNRRPCTDSEFTCRDGECIPSEYRCDKRHDCRDMSDEIDCVITGPRPPVPKPPVLRPCRADQATCQNGLCIPRDYLCDGERDCSDGSDEISCGTPSPCEPNEFKCQNGHCALKLWRCDGDNDCGDNSDESYCPVKSPGDTCAPEQFVCVTDRTCIPASYQCDEEPDCPDRSDENGCTPPTITSTPEESVMAVRGETVTFTCKAVGVPTPIITWRLNWGHIPNSSRITMTSVNGHGTLTIQDVKDGDQGAYTCEAINAKGMVFGIPDGVLTLKPPGAGQCASGQFGAGDGSACIPCFCFGITKHCQNTGRNRNKIRLRFTEEDNFKGVNVSFPSRPASPPLSSTQLLINTEEEEFQLVDLSRRFLSLESFWTLPSQFLGNKVDSYGGSLHYKVRFTLARGETEPVQKPDVVLVGNGQKLIYRRTSPTTPRITNEREIKFTEENWQHASGRLVTREDLMMTLVNLESINIRTTYDNRMVSVALSHIVMDTTTMEFSGQGPANDVEQCKCPTGYSGLSCESCASGFERVSGGSYLGTCAGCNCNGHASACDPISGQCLSCQHNTEGPQCNKCRPGYFGDPTRGRPDDCKPCPCPYTETSRRFSDSCFLDYDSQATCDACRPGYTGRRCEKCAPGYHGNPLQPNGKCVPQTHGQCDNRGTISSSSRPCRCKPNAVGALCDECRSGSFHLTKDNPDGCLQCFCMGVTKQCTSSTWSRDQVRGGVNGQLFSLANAAHTHTINDGIAQRGSSEVTFRFSTHVPHDVLFWVLPESFRGDKVTAYGGELRYTVSYVPRQHSAPIEGQPDVALQGNGIMLEHYSSTKPTPHVATMITVPFRESAWKRSDGQPCTREHLLMALADITVFMIRATYANSMTETGVADIWMDIAVPHSTGNDRALEVEECACPQGYRGPSCQECDVGYIRTGSGLYLGTCERCECHGYATTCDPDTGNCLQCQHNTAGPRCDRCRPGFYGDPRSGSPAACQPCPCPGTSPDIQFSRTCFLDSDGQPTCDGCPPGFTGRRCERCAAGYSGNPQLGQACTIRNDLNGNCYSCDQRGSNGCDSNGVCRCKAYVEGPLCGHCKPGHFHLSSAHKDGCLSCFCMGITQQCSSSSYYRDLVSSSFAPGHFQGFALVNRQRTNRIATGFTVEVSTQGTQLSFSRFGNLAQEAHYWQLPEAYRGDKVGSYGGRLKYTLSYVSDPRGSSVEDVDVQIIGNDITLVTRQPWPRRQGTRESRQFELVFKEENWQRPDGMPATREHLLMVLADLDDILIRASYYTDMRSTSISDVSMEVAVPNYTGLTQALEVEECRCPPGYQGLSCQDCAAGYTRTGGGLYLGHCELCDCNGHSDSCHPETGVCTNCLHNTMGETCEQCAAGFFGDPTAGTPEDCQPCACPHTDPENQFSHTCESTGNGGYQCTACQRGYTGQYCERCAPGYVGNPQERIKCRTHSDAASLVVRIQPERVQVSQGGTVTLRCQVTSLPPHKFQWSREDGRSLSSNVEIHRHGEELRFSSVQPHDAGVYICTCQDRHNTNRSRAEIVVTAVSTKPIEVTVEEPKTQSVRVGSTIHFICTAKSKSPAYTLVWTRQGRGNLPDRAVDFNGILTIHNVQPEDAGIYVCTGSNMLAMDEGTAILHVPEASQTQMFYTAYEMFEGHRSPADGSQPVATVHPPVLSVQQGQRAEFRCTVTGNPPPVIEWIGGPGRRINPNAVIRGEVLTIPAVDRADEAEYICKALNVHGEHAARAMLYVHSSSLPQVQVSPQTVDIHEGETLRLYCRAGGTPTPGLDWKRREGPLPQQAIPSHGFHQFKSNSLDVLQKRIEELQARMERTDIGTLLIPNMKASDAGTYLCVGTNSIGSSEASIKVKVIKGEAYIQRQLLNGGQGTADPIPTWITILPQVATVQEGQWLDLNCVVPGNFPASVTWRRTDRPLSSNHQVRGTMLRILQASREDAGEYICRLEGSSTVQQASVTVTVTSSTSQAITSVTIQPSIATVQEGNLLDLTCLVPGTSSASVVWQRAGRPLSSNHQVHGSVLRILRASADDAGEYTCRVEGGPAHQQASVTVSVTSSTSRLQTPVISIEPHNTVVRAGEAASFRCYIYNGVQPVRLEWKLENNQPLPDNVKVGPDNSVITITNAQPRNQGPYYCVASNLYGQTRSTASLIVKDSLKVTVTPESPVRVWVGEPINLECQARGDSRPSVSWHRMDNSRRIVLNSPVPMESNAVMQVLVARPEDAGTYICTAHSSEGTSEARVEVIIEGGPRVPSVPIASVPEPLMVVKEGQTVTLRCNARGYPTPTITWSKLRAPLPWRHSVVNNTLVLTSVGRQDSGQYICNATNNLGVSEVVIMLDVETPPYATTLPDDLSVRVGEVIRLQCLSHGTPPLTFRWTKVNGSMSARAEVRDGNLQINLATADDAGTYKCVVSNKVGSSEALAKVIVRSPLEVRVYPQVEVKAPGSAVEFTCSANGGIETTIEWLKEGGSLPANHHIKDGMLRIENLEKSNAGIYICRATSLYGQAQDTAKLTIQALPKVMINIRTSVQTVMLGSSVEFECHATGDPEPTVQWSKVDGTLFSHVVVKGGMLTINRVTEADAGKYRCTATNNVGSVQSEVVLNVQTLPQITAQPEVREVTVGSTAVFPCMASGYPLPQITWTKLEGPLAPKASQEGHVLTITNVTYEDSGTYVCTASNKQGKVQAFSMLKVHERIMPYFTQTPLSYLTLPTIKNSYKAFNIKITFRPDNVDGVILYAGMILYNGQKRITGADFISLGLVGGRPEFRFDVGSGMATIRFPTPIKLGEFHTVELYRNATQGVIIVDGQGPINGSSQGKFQGLDLNEELHVGGYPNYSIVSKTTGLKNGFVGCIRQLIIQGDEVIFKDLDRSSTGVSNCPTCKDRPCQNGGVCEDSETSNYKCECVHGFTGSNCEHHSSMHCHPEACGPDATCINNPTGRGYDCRCHLGKFGEKCMHGTLVTTPLFNGQDSFITYPPLTNIHNDLRVDLEFKPMEANGLMFFSGGKKMKVEDFVSLAMVDNHVEFRYELGTGMAILRSRNPVKLGQWHQIEAERIDRDGSLKVDQAREVRRSSPGKAQGLNIYTPMYLGGVPSMDILPKPANVSMLFKGCIGEVSINGKKVDLSYSFTESRSISQCVDANPCERRPCRNGGTCLYSAEYEFQCICQDGFEGELCEVVKDTCQHNSECQNGGRCLANRCACPSGFTGLFCEMRQSLSFPDAMWDLEGSGGNDSPAEYAAYFHDNGYLALPKSVFPRSSLDAPEVIELEIRTASSEGLILWQGVEQNSALPKLHANRKELGDQGKGKDFISLGLQNGHLVFSYQLGSGEARITSREPINNADWRMIRAVRTGKQGYIQIDGGPISRGLSRGESVMVNTKGDIYLGGAPDMVALTGGKFSTGITGCIRNLVLANTLPWDRQLQPIDILAHSGEGISVERCSS
ncbi:basement membrane-specific heparan sulfate proteoglycan core protein isoform X11 [Brienomyrus brachyistius]|uniref:basement membrane-specific heparan sulfate proteoglycan core protein isoform X11 n=1 Tax=Brienomyrus brachyistius TaxID=42636 RepID=UPI0020B3A746|nr:basement membrane-specific heparan sulfate proteoglycan core protein isoform X11 [Brienomyrus brachyistius]